MRDLITERVVRLVGASPQAVFQLKQPEPATMAMF
jgi:hypothetical protein